MEKCVANKKFIKKGGICRCCGTVMVDSFRCSGPRLASPCKYFGIDPKKKFGNRFRCRAEGREDGNCNGELEFSKTMMDERTRERVERFYHEDIEPFLNMPL